MIAPFRLYGAELSPYSVKVRSYLRFKSLPFEWLQRSQARQEEIARHAKLPLVPILVDAHDNAMQDSTPMIEALEREFPEPPIIPEDPALAFVAALLEDYADEWLNKAMFHYRWTYPADQESAARRIVGMIFEGAEIPSGMEASVRSRMVGRLHHVGSSPETAPVIEASFIRLLEGLNRLLVGRAYLFGGRPCMADFGLAGQLAQLLSDPTPGALMKAQAPNVVRWVDRMENPDVEGGFVGFDAADAGLAELLRLEVANTYLTWMSANANAVAAEAPHASIEIAGLVFSQRPQRYAAKALTELRRKRALVADKALDALLEETGCDAFLTGGAAASDTSSADEADESDGGHEQD